MEGYYLHPLLVLLLLCKQAYSRGKGLQSVCLLPQFPRGIPVHRAQEAPAAALTIFSLTFADMSATAVKAKDTADRALGSSKCQQQHYCR
jgi:hypothetical protein